MHHGSLAPVDSVIDPLRSAPGDGTLPAPVLGQRYLILETIGDPDYEYPTQAWGNVYAQANDIIQFDGVNWTVSFASRQSSNTQFCTNITTGLQYRWTGTEWVKSYEGLYPGGEWSIVF